MVLPKATAKPTNRFEVNKQDIEKALDKLRAEGFTVAKIVKADRIIHEDSEWPDYPITRVLWESNLGHTYLCFVDTGE